MALSFTEKSIDLYPVPEEKLGDSQLQWKLDVALLVHRLPRFVTYRLHDFGEGRHCSVCLRRCECFHRGSIDLHNAI